MRRTCGNHVFSISLLAWPSGPSKLEKQHSEAVSGAWKERREGNSPGERGVTVEEEEWLIALGSGDGDSREGLDEGKGMSVTFVTKRGGARLWWRVLLTCVKEPVLWWQPGRPKHRQYLLGAGSKNHIMDRFSKQCFRHTSHPNAVTLHGLDRMNTHPVH